MERHDTIDHRNGDGHEEKPRHTLIACWGRKRRLGDGEARPAVEEWRRALGVGQPVRLERIPYRQVTNERGERGCSLVGVVHDAETARIYHTRALTAEDIVHELLHVAHPAWSEEQVVAETSRLLGGRAPRSQGTVPAVRARESAPSPLPVAGTGAADPPADQADAC